jgi:hypothetical protein
MFSFEICFFTICSFGELKFFLQGFEIFQYNLRGILNHFECFLQVHLSSNVEIELLSLLVENEIS